MQVGFNLIDQDDRVPRHLADDPNIQLKKRPLAVAEPHEGVLSARAGGDIGGKVLPVGRSQDLVLILEQAIVEILQQLTNATVVQPFEPDEQIINRLVPSRTI
ncbi:hypothetical protein D3C80_1896770 [compost metagenome]